MAASIGVRKLWVKDETSRLGLPSFKILGASFALQRAIRERLRDAGEWDSWDQWVEAAASVGPMTLVTATEGNHGHAVAHLARLLDLGARVFVPAGTAPARLEAIAGEGAEVVELPGTYDDAIARLVESKSDRELVISDTSWEGYERIPRWVVGGYETIFAEIDEQLLAASAGQPDLVLVQAGVGALACAAVLHWKTTRRSSSPTIVSVEPEDAACVLAALTHGERHQIPGPHQSVMTGLNCGLVSAVALPTLLAGLDGAVTISNAHALAAARRMHREGVMAGPTGAVGIAGLLAISASARSARSELALDGVRDVLTICTEGITDRSAFEEDTQEVPSDAVARR
jgi:diaminopropionate ammonia-lyase